MKKVWIFAALIGFCTIATAEHSLYREFQIEDHLVLIGSQSTVPLQVVPMKRSPTPDSIEVVIVYPQTDSLEKTSRIRSQLRLLGYPLGVKTRVLGLPSLRESRYGQTMKVVIDNNPAITVTLSSEDSFDANLSTYRKMLNFNLPNDLQTGQHVIRTFPVLSFGESLKKPKNFDVSTFYKNGKQPLVDQDLKRPFLTYNEPTGEYKVKDPYDPILLDFYVSNCTLTREGYKVQLSINGEEVAKLYQWTPYLIYGLEKGRHVVKLELLGPSDNVMPGDFNQVEREIIVK